MYSERFALASGMMYEDDLSAMKKGKGEMAMGKWSSIGALMNKIENNQMLSEAKRLLDQDRWDRLRQSYRQLFWFQITPVFVFVIAIILVFFFCPTTAADGTQIKAAIILFGTAFFVLIFFPVWLILSQFVVGRLWHRYAKWYRQGGSLVELDRIMADSERKNKGGTSL
ncbi:hypothetical protein BN3662_00271 [Clostridiales bacterium CHKCI006]|nr:hypothetical protein BN3662_00271 [Clostridiales bacterium CHKCI006]